MPKEHENFLSTSDSHKDIGFALESEFFRLFEYNMFTSHPRHVYRYQQYLCFLQSKSIGI
jgi:hypothetical protein